ncbi:MAG: hypothetical protein JXR49_04915 [Acidobacteria bacterium]|nr:hypothetical protein [Acidobacteriota bacterium]
MKAAVSCGASVYKVAIASSIGTAVEWYDFSPSISHRKPLIRTSQRVLKPWKQEVKNEQQMA